MAKRIVLCALMLLPFSTAFADQATYTLSGGSFTLGSSIDVTSATVGTPAGTLSLNCPVTSTALGTYLWQYFCSGGTITMNSSDGLTVLNGTFTSGDLSLTASGGGRGGNTHYYYSFVGSLTGTLSHSGQSEAISGGMYFNVVPLRGQIGSGAAALATGAAEVSAVYGPVFVADTYNNQIVRIDSLTGANWATLGHGQGAGSKQFSNPLGIALDATKRIYVADTGNCRIARVDNITGANWTTKGACGTGTGKFNNPAGVAIDSTGRIYIADTDNNQIVRMNDMTGAGWTTLKTDSKGVNKLAGPRSLAFDAAGKIYIADTGNNRVVRVDDMTGANWTMLTSNSAGTVHYSSVYGIGVDSTGRIYVADMLADQIVRVDNMTGANWTTLGGPGIGSGVGFFSNPYGMALDPLTGAIFVADTQNGRIVRSGDMTTLDWSSYGRYGIGVGTFNGPQGIAPVPVSTPVPDAVLAPGSLTFPSQDVGTSSFSQNLTLANIGGAPLDITSIATTGDFSQTDTCGGSLPGGSDCTLSVTFKPTATGTRTGSLAPHDNSAGAAQRAVLSGTGTSPVTAVAPASLTFPAQLVSTASAAQSVTLSNTGTGALTISSVGASAGFTQTNNCGASVAPGLACTLNVTFKPTATGTVTGTLTVNGGAGTPAVNLSGTGASAAPAVTATPAGVLFPAQALKTKSAALLVSLANHGTAPVTITDTAITGDFSKTTTCTNSLAAGHSCTASVTFTPTATGIRTGSLTFTLSSGPLTVALTGPGTPSGTSEGLSVAPNPLDLGAVSLEDTQTMPVTLTNSNKIVIGIAGIKISGTAYSQNNNCGATLAAGASCAVQVTVNVTTAGTYSGTLTITESAGAVHSIPLTALGSNE
jgi:sugar lactone lactonase YvrE